MQKTENNAYKKEIVYLNCTPFVGQYGILFREWGAVHLRSPSFSGKGQWR